VPDSAPFSAYIWFQSLAKSARQHMALHCHSGTSLVLQSVLSRPPLSMRDSRQELRALLGESLVTTTERDSVTRNPLGDELGAALGDELGALLGEKLSPSLVAASGPGTRNTTRSSPRSSSRSCTWSSSQSGTRNFTLSCTRNGTEMGAALGPAFGAELGPELDPALRPAHVSAHEVVHQFHVKSLFCKPSRQGLGIDRICSTIASVLSGKDAE
jgi:hypothetical protein